MACLEFMLSKGWEEMPQDNFTVLAISEAFEVRNSIDIEAEDLDGYVVELRTKFENIFAIAEWGSPMSFLKENTAERLRQNNLLATFKHITQEDAAPRHSCYNGKTLFQREVWSLRCNPEMDESIGTVQHYWQSKSKYHRGEHSTKNWQNELASKKYKTKQNTTRCCVYTKKKKHQTSRENWVKENF